jgi:hypothetical protein
MSERLILTGNDSLGEGSRVLQFKTTSTVSAPKGTFITGALAGGITPTTANLKLYVPPLLTEEECRVYERACHLIFKADYLSNRRTQIEKYAEEYRSIIDQFSKITDRLSAIISRFL